MLLLTSFCNPSQAKGEKLLCAGGSKMKHYLHNTTADTCQNPTSPYTHTSLYTHKQTEINSVQQPENIYYTNTHILWRTFTEYKHKQDQSMQLLASDNILNQSDHLVLCLTHTQSVCDSVAVGYKNRRNACRDLKSKSCIAWSSIWNKHHHQAAICSWNHLIERALDPNDKKPWRLSRIHRTTVASVLSQSS